MCGQALMFKNGHWYVNEGVEALLLWFSGWLAVDIILPVTESGTREMELFCLEFFFPLLAIC